MTRVEGETHKVDRKSLERGAQSPPVVLRPIMVFKGNADPQLAGAIFDPSQFLEKIINLPILNFTFPGHMINHRVPTQAGGQLQPMQQKLFGEVLVRLIRRPQVSPLGMTTMNIKNVNPIFRQRPQPFGLLPGGQRLPLGPLMGKMQMGETCLTDPTQVLGNGNIGRKPFIRYRSWTISGVS